MPDGFEPDDGFVEDGFVSDATPTDWRTGGILDPNKDWKQKFDVLFSGPDQLRDAFGKPDSTSLLPQFKQPETYWGGFANSLYNDFIRPLASPEGFVGSSAPGKGGALIPEVLEAERPVIRGALPAHEEPFIAGPGGVQRQSILTPTDESLLAGYPEGNRPLSITDRSAAPTLDIGELRERERLASLKFTDFDLTGGTRLELPDKPRMAQPPVSGDTSLGFAAQSGGDLEYPLNVVPNSVRPRSTQAVTEALTPERFTEPIAPKQNIEFVSGQPDNFVPDPEPLRAPTAKEILPSAPKSSSVSDAARKAWRERNGVSEAEVTDARKAGLNPDNLTTVKAPPDIAKPVNAGVAQFVKESGKPSTYLKSVYTQLSEMGPAGKELVQRFQRAAQNRAEYDAAWTEPLLKIGKTLTKDERANFGAYVEQRLPIPNQRVRAVVDEWTRLQNSMGDVAVSEGLHLKRGDDVIPFQKISENYWPHNPVENLSKKDIVQRLVDKGMSRYDAVRVAKQWSDTGEVFLRGQHSRLKDVFPYKDDFDVAIQHGRSMSRRIANHVNLGPKDIAGMGDQGIAQLIEDTGQKDLAFALAKRLAGRDERPSESLMRGLNNARTAATLTSLPDFTLKNVILGQGMNAYKAIMSRHTFKTIAEMRKLFSSAYRDEIRAAGVYNTFNRTLAEEMGLIGKRDWFLIGAGEKINRAVSAAIGRATVRTAFEDFQATGNDHAAKLLETLLSRDPNTITEMTPELERFAAGRMSEITQGLSNPGNMPYAWSNPVNNYTEVARQLSLIFKKIGFQISKTVWDDMKSNPARAIPAWMATTQAAGELVGDVKSVLTGKERPDNPVLRIGQNWANAFMFGLAWDMATSAQYGPSAIIGQAVGPIAQKGADLGAAGWKTGERLIEGEDDPVRDLRRFGLRNLPIPGRQRMFGKDSDYY